VWVEVVRRWIDDRPIRSAEGSKPALVVLLSLFRFCGKPDDLAWSCTDGADGQASAVASTPLLLRNRLPSVTDSSA